MPSVRWRHPADCVQTVLPVRNHPWPSHCWKPPVAADILSAIRGRSGRSSRILANRSSRHQSQPRGALRPTGTSSFRPRTTAMSFKPRPTSCPRSTSTASERYRPQAAEAPGTANWDAVCADARKTPPQGDARRFGEPSPDGRHAQSRCSRTVRQPEDVAEVPLTGLSLNSTLMTKPRAELMQALLGQRLKP